MPAISAWIVAVEAAGPDWGPAGSKLDQFFLLPAVFRLDYGGLLHTLVRTATRYLDSQQKWKEFESAEHGLHDLLRHLAASMHSTAKLLLEKEDHDEDMASLEVVEVASYFQILSAASKFSCTFANYMSRA